MKSERKKCIAHACGAQVAIQTEPAQLACQQIKPALDVNAGDLVVVRMVDGAKAQPPQKLATERYLEWVGKQKAQAHYFGPPSCGVRWQSEAATPLCQGGERMFQRFPRSFIAYSKPGTPRDHAPAESDPQRDSLRNSTILGERNPPMFSSKHPHNPEVWQQIDD